MLIFYALQARRVIQGQSMSFAYQDWSSCLDWPHAASAGPRAQGSSPMPLLHGRIGPWGLALSRPGPVPPCMPDLVYMAHRISHRPVGSSVGWLTLCQGLKLPVGQGLSTPGPNDLQRSLPALYFLWLYEKNRFQGHDDKKFTLMFRVYLVGRTDKKLKWHFRAVCNWGGSSNYFSIKMFWWWLACGYII